MKKRVGIWIRVSTRIQAESESPEVHEKRARSYAEAKDWEVVTVYDLAGISGKSVIEHPETKRMIQDIASGHISGLIFSKISRLARNTRQLLEFSNLFREYNADLISIGENIDTSSPAGRLFYAIISAMAEWEREEISSRVKAATETRARLGKRLGGKAQYGYKWEGDKLVINPQEANIRKLMYEIFLESKRRKSVATRLNEMGYRSRTGAKFTSTVVKRWLRDPISKGLRRANFTEKNSLTNKVVNKPQADWVFHPCPAIVSEELWQEVNDIMDDQDRTRMPVLNQFVHIFTNYIKCYCGTDMHVRSKGYYKCKDKTCNHKIRQDDLEQAFKSRLIEFLTNKEELSKFFELTKGSIGKMKEARDHLKTDLQKVEQKIENIFELHSEGKITTDAFDKYHTEPYEQSLQLSRHLEKLDNEIFSESKRLESTEHIIKDAQYIYEKWDSFNRDRKREIIETTVELVIIGTEEITFNLKRIMPMASLLENQRNGGQTPLGLLILH